MKRSMYLLFAMLMAAPIVRAADVIVDSADACRQAIAAAKPGDAIVLKDGTYKDIDLKFYAEGTADQPITLRAATPGKVELTGQSRLHLAGKYLVVEGLTFRNGYVTSDHVIVFRGDKENGATHCRLTRCTIEDYNPPEPHSLKEHTQWISLYGHDNRVDHCTLRGKDTIGPMLVVWVEGRRNEHRIDHNYFAGRPPLGQNGGETIRVGTSEVSMNVSKTLVELNRFEHCDGDAEVISNKSCENVYRYNTFVENRGALVLRHGNRCTVEGNWFFGHGVDGTGGIRVIGEDHRIYNNYLDGLAGRDFESAMPFVNGIPNSKPNEYFRVQRAIVCFNTFVHCTQNITFGVGKGARNRLEPPVDCTIANNVIVGRDGPLVRFDDQPISTTWLGNILFGAESGVEQTRGVIHVDPKLVQGKDGIWRPAQDSDAIGAGAGDFAFVTEDIEGRPRGEKKDAGCVQIGRGGEAKRRPVDARDVGPDAKE